MKLRLFAIFQMIHFRSIFIIAGLTVLLMTAPWCAAADSFMLIDRALNTRSISDLAIDGSGIHFIDASGTRRSMPREQALALLQPNAPLLSPPSTWLQLSDGQRLPGQLAPDRSRLGEQIVWVHPWLLPMTVPLKKVAILALRSSQSVPESRGADVLVLTNGDRLEGIVISIGTSVELERTENRQIVRLPIDRIAAIALVSQPPSHGTDSAGTRLWFSDGTILDVDSLRLGDDGYVRLHPALAADSTEIVERRLAELRAILFDPESMVPLASIAPAQLSSETPRYILPAPRVIDLNAPIGLSSVEFAGPIVVHYALPAGARRFAALAKLPEEARDWGDCEIIIRDEDREVFRARLNGSTPERSINVQLAGSELTIEVTSGAHGPIQDRIILADAMLLIR